MENRGIPSPSGDDLPAWTLRMASKPPLGRRVMRPSAGLRVSRNGAECGWRAKTDGEAFALDFSATHSVLPAGWYLLEGFLRSEAEASPRLRAGFHAGARADEEIRLPHPDIAHRLSFLVLLTHDVASLELLPGVGACSFSIDGFVLRKLGRFAALRQMILAEGLGKSIGRLSEFILRLPAQGVSGSTRLLYDRYRGTVAPRVEASGDYSDWASRYDTFSGESFRDLARRAEALESTGNAPGISVILPIYQTPERWLRRAIESVMDQAYAHWELCISDDASPDAEVRAIVREYAEADPRIKYAFREHNGHISASTNSAIELATQPYLSFLDHDDELRPHALLEVAEAIVRNPGVGLLYSDEDKIDGQGRRFHPNFKPDWNPDLLRSQNYICHLSTIRTDLVREVGGLRVGFEGSQDHDLVLRCIERLAPGQIHHIPKVLYHWRAIEGSTALARDAKDYAAEAGARAVQEHLDRIGSGACADMLPHGHYRVRWPLPEPVPKASLVIPTRDKVDLLRVCLESILGKTTYADFEIVVVDNQSSDPEALAYLAHLASHEKVRVLRYDAPFNYSAINNWAVQQCDGTIIGLLNNDIEIITPGWLEEMVSHAIRPEVGAVGAMLYYPSGTIQHAGVILGIGGVANHAYLGMPRGYPGHGARALVAQNLSAVTGACLVVRREVYTRVGGLDERLAVAFNDIDFCLRIREAGHWNVWTPFAEMYHHESASRGQDLTEEKRARFEGEVMRMQGRWRVQLEADPAYNPNLTLSTPDFGLARPPRTSSPAGAPD